VLQVVLMKISLGCAGQVYSWTEYNVLVVFARLAHPAYTWPRLCDVQHALVFIWDSLVYINPYSHESVLDLSSLSHAIDLVLLLSNSKTSFVTLNYFGSPP